MNKIDIIWSDFQKLFANKEIKCDIKSLGTYIEAAHKLTMRYQVRDKKTTIVDLLSKLAEEVMDDKSEEIYFKMLESGTILIMVDAAFMHNEVRTKIKCCIIL
jgi:hypothetical protein